MERVSNKKANDYIVEILKDNIIAGNIDENEAITQELLSETLNVSRMPVREAIATLIQEGFMERLPNRRVKIVKLTTEGIREVFLFTSSMENKMAKLVINKIDNLDEYIYLKSKIENETNIDKLINIEIEFHQKIINNLENKYIDLIFDKVFNGYPIYAIKNKGTVVEKKENIDRLLNVIIAKEESKIEEAFDRYYTFYSDRF